MDEIEIIEVIKRRQAKFQGSGGSGPQGGIDEVSRFMADEYDSLLAEIEAFRSNRTSEVKAVANSRTAEVDNRVAEAEILGDQGQSGG